MRRQAPVPTSETRPFWEACARGELLLQICTDCAHVQAIPRMSCAACQSQNLDWRPASGRGSVHTFTVVHRAPTPAFKEKTPYILVLIDLEEGGRLLTYMRNCTPDQVGIGLPVRIAFERVEDAVLPVAEPLT